MVVSGVAKKYNAYRNSNDDRWEFANSILYKLCQDYPSHDNRDVIVGKIWLIGRSYSAAIERRRNANESADVFYYDIVAPKMIEIGAELDSKLDIIRKSKKPIRENLADILSAHKYLMDVFYELTKLEKRSLASKYLHFHCPDSFFIYDQRAQKSIRSIVEKPDCRLLNDVVTDYDATYAIFVCRMLELQAFLKVQVSSFESPRNLDSFLLNLDGF